MYRWVAEALTVLVENVDAIVMVSHQLGAVDVTRNKLHRIFLKKRKLMSAL